MIETFLFMKLGEEVVC